MLSVIIPTYRNPQFLDLCIQSAIENCSSKTDFEIITVIDGYVEESEAILDKYQALIKRLDFEENMGMQSAINYGVYNAAGEYVFIINDDNVFGPNWNFKLDETIQTFDKDDWILTVDQIEASPSMFGFHTITFGEVSKFNSQMFNDYCTQIDEFVLTKDGNIFPFVVSKKNFMIVGGFDTFYSSPFWCDVDFFLKLELMGLRHFRTHSTHMYHFGSTATKFGKDAKFFTESEQIAMKQFIYKWGFLPDIVNNALTKNNTKFPIESVIHGITF